MWLQVVRARAVVVAAGVVLSMQPALLGAARAYADDVDDGADVCTPIPVVEVAYLDPVNGVIVHTPAPTFATVYLFDMGGSRVPQIIPPVGWNPLSAKEEELDLFGFQPRPVITTSLDPTTGVTAPDPEAVQAYHDWQEAYSHWQRMATPGMCRTLDSSSSVDARSINWAGVENYSSTNVNRFRKVSGAFTQPSFQGVCAHQSAHSIWTGLGGEDTPQLFQSGTDASRKSVNGAFAWWEAASYEHDTSMIKFSNLTVRAGDRIRPWSAYTPANPRTGQPARVKIAVDNLTTGESASVSPAATLDGVPLDRYYNGSSAEFIDERPTNHGLKHPVDGKFYYLRKMVGSVISWTSMYSNDRYADSYYHMDNTMQRPSPYYTWLEDVDGGMRTPTSFDSVWDACA